MAGGHMHELYQLYFAGSHGVLVNSNGCDGRGHSRGERVGRRPCDGPGIREVHPVRPGADLEQYHQRPGPGRKEDRNELPHASEEVL